MIRPIPPLLAALCLLALFAALPAAHAVLPVTITGTAPGATPFISFVSLHIDNPNAFDHAQFSVQPKAGSVTRPVSARYSRAYLLRRGYLHADTGEIVVPVFGLYANRANTVTLTTGFVDGNSQIDTVAIDTTRHHDPYHNHPEVLQARLTDTTLSYDFFLLKNFDDLDSPTIIDTDGEVRWVGTAGVNSIASAIYQNGVYVANAAQLIRMEFDGTVTPLQDYSGIAVTAFHHNFDFGRDGLVAGVNTSYDLESVVIEIDAAGTILHSWNLADIIGAAMVAGGDDPSQFINRTIDWFHQNSAAYRASDNTLLVSGREDFVIALDYDTGAIKWIFGDPTKHWYEFPSLRRYALTYPPGTHEPIGQHALSFVDDQLLLFDDGFASGFQTPAGANRTYSAARKYEIDAANLTARETWTYAAHRSLYSPIASSVYEDQPGNYLFDYATLGPYLYTMVRGVDDKNQIVFEYKYSQASLASSGWNAVVAHLENMVFD